MTVDQLHRPSYIDDYKDWEEYLPYIDDDKDCEEPISHIDGEKDCEEPMPNEDGETNQLIGNEDTQGNCPTEQISDTIVDKK
ncbi:hypothetical protein J6590_084535 [Homalodisca vitripennis]|nr:hypothetical protein J6590_084535 [Homalodisca vitripennis]